MPELALYYPYIHVRDDAWLKAAALHWPKLARLLPSGYPADDSDVARALADELGFLVPVDTMRHARGAAEDLHVLVEQNTDELRERYGTDTWFPADPPPGASAGGVRGTELPSLAFLYDREVPSQLGDRLVELGLAIRIVGHRGSLWLCLHPDLAAVYMTHLAEDVARSNGMSVVTDQPDFHSLLSGWSTERLAEALLGDQPEPAVPVPDRLAETYAVLAIRTYVPANLATVPVKRIIKARKVLLPEFHAFRDHLESLHDDLTEIAQLTDPNVRQARLELLLEKKVRVPGADLEQKLRKLGFEPARAVLSAKTPALPAAATGLGVPPLIAQGAMVAGRFVSAVVAGEQAAEGERRNAHGYLLGLREELDPRGVVDRVRRTFRHLRRR